MNGIASGGNPPLKWSESQNIKWKVKLEGDASNSSPVIWGDKIFFQTAVDTKIEADTPTPAAAPMPRLGGRPGGGPPAGPGGRPGGGGRRGSGRRPGGGRGFGMRSPTTQFKFNLVCMDRKSGEILWEKTVRQVKPHEGHHGDHGFASYSPVTDGKLVWANFGSRGVCCFDTDGNPKWSRDLGTISTVMSFGEGGSLAVAGDAVIVVRDQEGDSLIYALNKETGNTIWKKPRDEGTSWATPLPVEVGGKIQIVTSASNAVRSYDIGSGDVIWQCGGQTRNVIPTPVADFGMVYCASGFRGSALLAIKLGATGNLTNSDSVAWQVKEATPYVPSPLLYDGRIYVCDVNKEVISCYDAKTGTPHFVRQKMDEIKGVYSSPAAAAGRVYFVGRNGVSYVLKPSDKYEVLAVNKLDDNIDCSPAFVGDEMYLKGKQNLYCIAASN